MEEKKVWNQIKKRTIENSEWMDLVSVFIVFILLFGLLFSGKCRDIGEEEIKTLAYKEKESEKRQCERETKKDSDEEKGGKNKK